MGRNPIIKPIPRNNSHHILHRTYHIRRIWVGSLTSAQIEEVVEDGDEGGEEGDLTIVHNSKYHLSNNSIIRISILYQIW